MRMMTKDQIRFLLGDVENERVERTVSTKDTDKFAKAICAFANDLPNKRQPGYLFIGAHDDGTLNGLKVTDELLRNLAGLRADGNIQPKPALMVEKVSFPEGDIAVIQVQPSKITPVKYKGVIYVRIGARKSEANVEEERILSEKSEIKSPTFDTTPCLHSTINDLDLRLFKTEYLPKVIKTKVLKQDKRTIKQQLASLNLYDIVNDCPTVAGILLTGNNPVRVLFGAYIQYVKFEGVNRTSKVLNERQFSGNLITMLKEIDAFIKYTIQTRRPVFVTVLREEIRINYPYEAVRELIMNNIMHRNYQTNSPAKFYEYTDRIEIDNPGNLYGKVRPDNFPNETDYRNPIIAQAIKDLGYVNRFGRGINMVQEILEENRNGHATFDFEDLTTFKVVVMNADYDVESGAENGAENDIEAKNGAENGAESYIEKEILALIKKDSQITRKTIAILLGVGTSTVFRHIELFKNCGIIKRVGGSKGYWKINEPVNGPVSGPVNGPVSGPVKLTERQTQILSFIQENETATREAIAKQLNVGRTTIFRDISALKKLGIIERVGADKDGYWKIKQLNINQINKEKHG
jgi:ATP-dependent DNA helicase RecG